jgi:hypothetical protein
MKILILSKSSQELITHILSCLGSLENWIVVSSFQANCEDWKTSGIKVQDTKQFKDFVSSSKNLDVNIIFDSFVGTLDSKSNDVIKNCKHLIIISQKPDIYFPLIQFSDIIVSQTKSSSKLLHFYNLIIEPNGDYTFDMFKADSSKSKFMYLNNDIKVPVKTNDFSILKSKFNPTTSNCTQMKLNENSENSRSGFIISKTSSINSSDIVSSTRPAISDTCVISKNSTNENNHSKLSIQLTPLVSMHIVKKELETMCSNILISNMLISFKFSSTGDYFYCNFLIREKRLDLFGVLLLNMIVALKESGKITKGCICV